MNDYEKLLEANRTLNLHLMNLEIKIVKLQILQDELRIQINKNSIKIEESQAKETQKTLSR